MTTAEYHSSPRHSSIQQMPQALSRFLMVSVLLYLMFQIAGWSISTKLTILVGLGTQTKENRICVQIFLEEKLCLYKGCLHRYFDIT